ncbi:CPBP family intramembrane metalloprotease [Stigmatella sp. ncwal1]|uniref:CPBP family intramembrane metalloprotease n=1 Tax=Stigmatella ashevillensis TaxID=2995309 RepID=A0ABT5D361_9BACT|nr:CPBP family intramembrane glutamic endopeptidase [Stigmatella ashevillena]MDC0708101.1 CPBP family intramembrane metalloprotease [Stigmatella ashevillena]
MSRRFLSSRVGVTLITLAVFFLIDRYIHTLPFLRLLPRDVRLWTWQGSQVLVCLLAVALVHRLRPRAALSEVGLGPLTLRAIGFCILATLPMILTYGAAAGFQVHLTWKDVMTQAVMSPLAEEVLFRGYVLGQLQRRAGWPFWGAALVGLAPFALAHLYQSTQAGHDAWETAGVLAITGMGHLFFSWLLERWGDLWVPVGMHALMNLSWEAFQVDSTALGGTQANVARFATVGLAIGLTLVLRRGTPGWGATPPAPA